MKKTAGKKKAWMIGYAREDFRDIFGWVKPAYSYTKTQERLKVAIPSIYDKDDKYIDKRTRFKKVKVRITIEEI